MFSKTGLDLWLIEGGIKIIYQKGNPKIVRRNLYSKHPCCMLNGFYCMARRANCLEHTCDSWCICGTAISGVARWSPYQQTAPILGQDCKQSDSNPWHSTAPLDTFPIQ